MSESTTAETGDGAEAKAMLRVTVFGPESTGKTTLARHLSRRFDGLYMPEFGRVYTHALGIEEAAWQPQQLSEIASQHAMLREEIEARGGTRLMVEDTDVVKTAIWSDLLCGTRDPGFDWDGAALPDLYLLLTPETPFVQDVIRMHARQARREAAKAGPSSSKSGPAAFESGPAAAYGASSRSDAAAAAAPWPR